MFSRVSGSLRVSRFLCARIIRNMTVHSSKKEAGLLEGTPSGTMNTPASLQDAPREGQLVSHLDKTFTTVREGAAYILVPESASTSLDPKGDRGNGQEVQSVFYNPIQQFNRDLSVLAIRAFGEDLIAVKQQKSEAKATRGTKRKRKHEGVTQVVKSENDPQNSAASNGSETSVTKENIQRTRVDGQLSALSHEPDNDVVMMNEGDESKGGVSKPELVEPAPTANEKNESKEQKPTYPARRFRILDALSATGLRALRYAQEIPFVTSVTANDISREAVQSIEANVKHKRLEDKIQTVTGNAMSHMYSFVSNPGDTQSKSNKYDVIDLDPYGTAAPFLDAAVHAINDGGLLCVTCTDAAIFASCGYLEKTYSQYGGTPLKGLHSHEGGLRLILHAIASSAARYGLSIEPLLSLSIDYYARVFVRVYHSPAEVKFLAGKTMLVYNCDAGCGAWTTQYLARHHVLGTKNSQTSYKFSLAQGPTASTFCEHCGNKTHISGPMFGGPLHNPKFISTILSQLPTLDENVYGTTDRLEGMLTTALEETLLEDQTTAAEGSEKPGPGRLVPRLDASLVDRNPFFFVPSALAKVLHARAPSEAEVRGALKSAGYAVTRSHARPGTIKTNAPWSFIWEMMREWVRQKAPIKEDAIKKGTPGWGILHKDGGGEAPIAGVTSEDAARAVGAGTETIATIPEQGEESLTRKPRIVFDERLGKELNKQRLRRYQENPRANWGPMNRAKKGFSGT